MKVKLIRFFGNDKQMLGLWTITDGSQLLFNAKTLELGWKNNEPQVSCIPAGTYPCKWTRSNRLSELKGEDFFTYEILNVPNRAGIRIHSANYYHQLRGCISMGSMLKDLNADMELDVVHSGDTVKQFDSVMGGKDFELEIVENL